MKTSEKRSKNQLKSPNDLYSLFENAPFGFALLKNNKINEYNSAFKQYIGQNTNLEEEEISSLLKLSSQITQGMEYTNWLNGTIPRITLKSVQSTKSRSTKYTVFLSRVDPTGKTPDAFCIIFPDMKSEEKIEYPVSAKIKARHLKLNSEKKHPESEIYFTNREIEILKLSAQGLPVKQISKELDISARTVEKHRYNIIHKTNSSNIAEALYFITKNS